MFWPQRTTTVGGRGGRRGGGGGGGGKKGPKRGERPQKSAADLDAEMEVRLFLSYMQAND
jgi:hypothetical protein